MYKHPLPLTKLTGALAFVALSVPLSSHAAVYDFKFMRGAQRLPAITEAGQYFFVEVTENSSTLANDVLFKLTSIHPEPYSRIQSVHIDTGSFTDLITSVSIHDQSPGNAYVMLTPAAQAFLPDLSPEYRAQVPNPVLYDSRYLSPGEYLTLSATLGADKRFADVINAMNVGIESATASTGLRLGVIALHNLGMRPDPTKTLSDDGGYVTNSMLPVPEPSTWAMMIAGLGLLGLVARRSRV